MKVCINGKIEDLMLDEIKQSMSIEEKLIDLKQQLQMSDYKAIKYAEGWINEDDYATIKSERQAMRDQINELELQLYREG